MVPTARFGCLQVGCIAKFAPLVEGREMLVLETRDLTRTLGDEVKVTALRGVSVSVPQAEFVSIMGPSGSGKSTLLHLLGGIDAPTSGQVLLEGKDLASLNDDERTLLRRRRIGFIFQAFNLLPTLTSLENVALPLLLDGISATQAEKRAREQLDLVSMGHRHDHLPGQLSGGEQQRVAIARALVIQPAVLLADEPTGNLDSVNGEQVTKLLRSLVDDRRQTIVMVSHDPHLSAHADRIIHLRDGMVESDEIVRRSNTSAPSDAGAAQ